MTVADSKNETGVAPVQGKSRLHGLQRYALAVVAPSSVSAAHFIVQLLMLAHVQPSDFGTFAFLMVLVQLGYGLSNALISTPYDVNVSRSTADDDMKKTLIACNLIYAVLFGFACLGAGLTLISESWIYLFAVFGGVSMIRWFGRVFCYASQRPTSAALSDLVYSGTLCLAAVAIVWTKQFSMSLVCLAFIAAACLGALCLGSRFLYAQFSSVFSASLSPYRAIWLEQSRWTLIGVVSTETTNNIHSYLVTWFAGPSQFAPISAAALFLRPVMLSITALTQLERPAMGRALAAGNIEGAKKTRFRFHIALLLTWAATMILAIGILMFHPSLIIKPSYNATDIKISLALFSVITLSQIWGAPNNVFLQAARSFKKLSNVSIVSSVFSIVGVLLLLTILPPVYSLIGIVIGQVVMSTQIAFLVKNWKPANG